MKKLTMDKMSLWEQAYAWLKQEKNRRDYANQWVALHGGNLLASAPSRAELHSILTSIHVISEILVSKVEWQSRAD